MWALTPTWGLGSAPVAVVTNDSNSRVTKESTFERRPWGCGAGAVALVREEEDMLAVADKPENKTRTNNAHALFNVQQCLP